MIEHLFVLEGLLTGRSPREGTTTVPLPGTIEDTDDARALAGEAIAVRAHPKSLRLQFEPV